MRLMILEVKSPEKSRNNVFTSKQTTKRTRSNIFRGLEVETNARFMFSKEEQNTKGLLWNILSR